MPAAIEIVLLCTVATAGLFDLRDRRIPNWLNLSGIAAGLAANLLLFAGHGIVQALLGLGCALVVYIPLYCLRGMGAGDVKLMAAVGAIAGPRDWFGIFLTTAILGGVVSFIYVLYRRRWHETVWNMVVIVTELAHARGPVGRNARFDVRHREALRLPHGTVIALGVIAFLAFGSRLLPAAG